MKTLKLLPLLSLFTFSVARTVAAEEVVVERIPLTPPQIEELVAPIALYPDPLVALILPASTFPSDVVLAARFLDKGGSIDNVAAEPWDDSVRSLARYREVIDYLDDHLEWTRRLGYCFLDQPDAVMDAIQTIRIRARTAGLLQDTPEQRVIVETEEICIVPAQPTFIYVPRYDPVILCRPSFPYYSRGPFISFGIGWRVGTWLNFDCDWRSGGIRVVNRPSNWYHRPDWHDRNRYTHYTSTTWTRRNHSRNDDRFDRSPRFANYDARGADHRNASDPNRYNSRLRDNDRRDGNRWDDDNRRDNGRYGDNSRSDRSRGWNNRRRQETASPQLDLNPAGAAVIPPVATTMPQAEAVVPPVAAPMPQAQQPGSRFRRPDPGASTRPDRYNSADRRRDRDDRNDRNDRNPSYTRTAPTRVESPPVVERPQPRIETPPPERRVEASDRSNRSDDRGRNDNRDRSNRSSDVRNSDRDVLR